ncbi:MAG: DNA-binding protein [Lachnospiraceae bacterium]
MSISESTAYVIIRQFNGELKEKGFYIQAGRISRKYFYERTGLEQEVNLNDRS